MRLSSPAILPAMLVVAGLLAACAELRVDPLPEPIRPPKEYVSAAQEEPVPAETPVEHSKTTDPTAMAVRHVRDRMFRPFGGSVWTDPVR